MPGRLDAKEQLYGLQQQYLRTAPVVVQVGLNLPGGFVRYPWERLFAAAKQAAKQALTADGRELLTETELQTAVGPYCLLAVRADGLGVKRQLVHLEENAACGRLWDLDVLTAAGPIDRAVLGLPPRACLLCKESAHVCRKLGKHPLSEVIAAAERIAARLAGP